MNRKVILFGALIVAATVLLVLIRREKRPKWPPQSAEGKAASRVEAFIEAAHRAELQACSPMNVKALWKRAENEKAAVEIRDRYTRYLRDLEELVGVHCMTDIWKRMAGGISYPPQFDPTHHYVSNVASVGDGRLEVDVRDNRPGDLHDNVVFHLEPIQDTWKVSNYFFVSQGPRKAFPPDSQFAPPPKSLTLPTQDLAIDRLVPELASHKRTAIALHPYRDKHVPADSSHFGGLMLGNEPDGWPRCQYHNSNHIGVLQLLQRDYPDLPFPDGTDVLQLTWCPIDHDTGLPEVVLRWRTYKTLAPPQGANPEHRWPQFSYVPQPCRLYSDRIMEYPDAYDEEMQASLRQQIVGSSVLRDRVKQNSAATDNEVANHYVEWFGPYRGTKLFGYAAWIQSPETPRCNRCGQSMQLLLSIQSWEPWNHPGRQPIELPRGTPVGTTSLMIGDAGCAYIFICRQCPDLPVLSLMQCS